MRTSLAVAAAALALFSAPIASAAEAPVETTAETTESTGFTFYKSFGREFADHFRCSTSPERWWCGG